MRVLTAAQMREADRKTIGEIGIPSAVLMENAGRQVVAAMDAAFADLVDARVVILSGPGNNGGDGFVVARTLAQRGVDVDVYLIGDVADVQGDARINLQILGRLDLEVVEVRTAGDWELHSAHVTSADLIVDALFGTGLHTPLSGIFETIVDDVNDADVPVVAIDLPSGLSADSADPIGPHILATMTVTLGAPKYPLVLPPAEALSGTMVVADIGIPVEIIAGLDGPYVDVLVRDEVRDLVPDRDDDAHKGTFGHVLLVSGSRGKTGAAHLAAVGALRSGAGLVTVATPASCMPIVAALGPEYMTLPVAEDRDGAFAPAALIEILAATADVIAVGPGIGTGPGAVAVVDGLLDRAGGPLILDADALNVLAGRAQRLSAAARPVIITPHPGEMARLAGVTTADVQRDRIGVARAFAERYGVFVILKGHRTVIATPDGRVSINTTGNPGMSTGGSGDVLTGMLAAWLGQLQDAEHACQLAVYLHGAAGDLAADDHGQVAMIASDIVLHLADAVLELLARDHHHPDDHDA
jgi:NAD(P)H-hydrate epimerase